MPVREEMLACPIEREITPARKALFYLSIGASIGVCMFFFFAAWLALFG